MWELKWIEVGEWVGVGVEIDRGGGVGAGWK